MSLVLKDRVLETCTSPGTGTITLLGAVTGYQAFSTVGNGNTCYYAIADQNGANWEVGIGTYSSGTLARTTVLSSSNAGSLTNFSTGSQNVFLTYPSERSVNLSSAALTSGRVTFATTDGLLTDSANLTFSGSILAVTGTQTVTNSSGSTLTLDRTSNPGSLQLNFGGTQTGQVQALSGGGLIFYQGSTPTEAMRITSAGTLTTVNDASVNGLTVGRGGGALSTNAAFGTTALGATNTGAGYAVGVGYQALQANTSGEYNTAVGGLALYTNTSGSNNSAYGFAALYSNSSGTANVAVGRESLNQNTTASNNTAVGYQAGYTNQTGVRNTFLGDSAGYAVVNTTDNTFIGQNSGASMTSGAKNTILGRFSGNNGGLDIRTASNYIVLSDGDGNPRQVIDSSGNVGIGTSSPSARLSVITSTMSNQIVIGVNPSNTVYGGISFNGTNADGSKLGIGGGGSGDANLYIDVPTAGAFIFRQGSLSTNVLTINSSGNVGIGPTSPVSKLDVTGQVTATGGFFKANGAPSLSAATAGEAMLAPDSGSGAILYGRGTNYDVAICQRSTAVALGVLAGTNNVTFSGSVGIGTSSPNTLFSVAHVASAGTSIGIQHSSNNAQLLRMGWNDSSDYTFINTSNGSRPLVLQNTGGNVGIGTSSPSGKLQIDSANVDPSATATGITLINSTSSQATSNGGSISLGGVYTGSSITQFGYILGAKANSTDGNYAGYLSFGTRPNGDVSQERMRIDSSGNVFVGNTTDPLGGNRLLVQSAATANNNRTFSVYNTAATSTTAFANRLVQISSNGSGADATIHFSDQVANNAYFGMGSGALYFATGGTTERMRIDSSGNLLVGTTSSSGNKLDVVGGGVQVTASGTLYNLLNLKDSVDQSGATYVQFYNSTGAGIGNINRVGITNAVVYNTTSDYRLKTVTGSVTGQGSRIDALKPIDYQWKEGNQQARGFLAHEFQTVYPNSVSGKKDAIDADGKPVYQGMQASTTEVIADLVAEIQSLRQRIATLENK